MFHPLRFLRRLWLLFVFLCLTTLSQAQENSDNGSTDDSENEESPVSTDHEVFIGGKTIRYTATTGMMPLKNKKDEERANIFYVAYTQQGGDPAERPLMFSFNGGPGSSSVWLHLGALGPRRVAFPDAGTTLPKPPFKLVDNDASILDKADLVFIDPVSTGFSRAKEADKAGEFHGLHEDINSVGDFVRLYTSLNGRWISPKFLIGESYGAIRAAGLVDHMQGRYGMYFNGVVLLSGLLDYSTLQTSNNNETPFVLFLPTMTATAFHFKKLGEDLGQSLEEAVRQSEKFAQGAYARALLQGDTLPTEERKTIVRELARYTGLSEDYVDRSDLRITPSRFREELLRGQRKIFGRFDSRVTGLDDDHVTASAGFDPSYSIVLGPFSAGINDYLRRELKYESDMPYEILTRLNWNFPSRNSYVDVSESLARAITNNPHLKIMVACGYFDLATPHMAIQHSLNHMDIDPSLRTNIRIDYYEGGHMMYTNEKALEKLKTDLSSFISDSR